MRKLYFSFILLLFIIIFQSCGEADLCDCIKKSGPIDSIEIPLNEINTIEIYQMFNIFLIQDTVNKAIIQTNKNLIPLIELTESDSLLNISDNNICNFMRSYDNQINIYLHLTNIEKIFLYGPSTIISNDTIKFEKLLIRVYDDIGDIDLKLDCNHFWLEYWFATGTANISGKTVFFEVLNHGYANIYAYNLESQYVNVDQNSSGEIELKSIETLSVYLKDVGNVYYTGNPTTVDIIEKKSTGELIHVDK